MAVIDKVGRKPMLLVGSVVMFVSMVLTGIIVAKFRHNWPSHRAAGWTAVSFIWVYIGAFGATWGPASWTLVAEIFPLSIRAKGASIGASSNWVNNFAIAFFVPPMFEAWAWGTVFKSRTGEADRRLLAECRRELGLEESLEDAALEEVRRMSVGAEKAPDARVEVA
ncbi:hypothetical protein PRZ48_004131 [Zasmidium cellare]|uniref:Major facilitator superfamily (MFS) profile domain-containing protein n=1 Tax=Zasmidium cellare TaxID=395010 RepID=A0ABR0EYK1_ZASCE|nr:hypothetical protein PRZ48_004131 [Zasmidium cellare]